MIESATFHVMTTELVVGSFALAGLCFVLHSLLTFQNKENQFISMMDSTAHIALMFGLLALPFAILSGLGASPSGAHTSPLLANKMLLSTAGGGLALGVLFTRWRMGTDNDSRHLHNAFGSISTGCMLLTASLGGTYSRADSLTEFLPFVKENTLLLPAWMSVLVILVILAALIVRQKSAIKHG